MSSPSLALVALLVAGPLALLVAHLAVGLLKRIALKKTAKRSVPRPKLWARSANGGERAVKALMSMGGGVSK